MVLRKTELHCHSREPEASICFQQLLRGCACAHAFVCCCFTDNLFSWLKRGATWSSCAGAMCCVCPEWGFGTGMGELSITCLPAARIAARTWEKGFSAAESKGEGLTHNIRFCSLSLSSILGNVSWLSSWVSDNAILRCTCPWFTFIVTASPLSFRNFLIFLSSKKAASCLGTSPWAMEIWMIH